MLHERIKSLVGISFTVVMVCGLTTKVFSSDTSTNILSPGQIFEKVRENYASLSSYSDEGQIVTASGDNPVGAAGFTIRLARPNFYQIEWSRFGSPSDVGGNSIIHAVWSSGAGDYVELGWGVQRQYDQDFAFIKAAATSGNAPLTIPRSFFSAQQQDQNVDSIVYEKRLADQKVGSVDCYVISRDMQDDKMKTFWIGKRDFFIYQVRIEVSAKAIQQAWAGASNGSRAIVSNFQGFSSIETHTNIVVNQPFTREDFIPSFPLYQKPN